MPNNKKDELSDDERLQVANFLLTHSKNGKLCRGLIKATATEFKRSRRTISRIWKIVKVQIAKQSYVIDVSSKKANRGKKKTDRNVIQNRIKQVEWNKRQNLRSLGSAVGVPKSTLARMLKEGKVQRSYSYLKPQLNHQGKINRLRFCLSKVDLNTGRFDPMYQTVHVDEKWFYLMHDRRKYYFVEGESIPHRSVHNKRFVLKVMFLCAVARPRPDYHRKKMFSGKLGIWPFVSKVPAKRSSVNRPRGTLETKPVNVDGKVYSDYIKEKVLPAIRNKMPPGSFQ